LSNVKFECGCDACYIAELTAKLREAEQDAKRLDSGCIVIDGRDEFGEKESVEHRGLNLRAAIDRAIGNKTEGA
jgi:hypothetical protein